MKHCACGCQTPLRRPARNQTRFITGHYLRPSPEQRLKNFSINKNNCWIWNGYRRGRYGSIFAYGKNHPVHRFSYEMFVGKIPDGLTLDHLCREPFCINPNHLEPVTMRENILRGTSIVAINSQKTHCLRGHFFSQENTYIKRGGQRLCRTCHRARGIAFWHKYHRRYGIRASERVRLLLKVPLRSETRRLLYRSFGQPTPCSTPASEARSRQPQSVFCAQSGTSALRGL